MYFCKIVTNTKIKHTRNHSNRWFNTWIWNEQRTKDGLFITCICHITAAQSQDISRARHLRNISYWYVISRVLISSLVNECTLVPTVFRWYKKMEFKLHFYFSFFFGLVKWNSISISIFRFLSTCDIEKRIWISFFVFRFRRTLKRGFEFRFLFFVFS